MAIRLWLEKNEKSIVLNVAPPGKKHGERKTFKLGDNTNEFLEKFDTDEFIKSLREKYSGEFDFSDPSLEPNIAAEIIKRSIAKKLNFSTGLIRREDPEADILPYEVGIDKNNTKGLKQEIYRLRFDYIDKEDDKKKTVTKTIGAVEDLLTDKYKEKIKKYVNYSLWKIKQTGDFLTLNHIEKILDKAAEKYGKPMVKDTSAIRKSELVLEDTKIGNLILRGPHLFVHGGSVKFEYRVRTEGAKYDDFFFRIGKSTGIKGGEGYDYSKLPEDVKERIVETGRNIAGLMADLVKDNNLENGNKLVTERTERNVGVRLKNWRDREIFTEMSAKVPNLFGKAK